jgi:DNA-binding beta-propeller fold protein YncE
MECRDAKSGYVAIQRCLLRAAFIVCLTLALCSIVPIPPTLAASHNSLITCPSPSRNTASALEWLQHHSIHFPVDDYYSFLSVDQSAKIGGAVLEPLRVETDSSNPSMDTGGFASCPSDQICVVGATWSPDRSLIAFEAGDPQSERPSEVFVARVRDGTAWRVSDVEELQDAATGHSDYAAFDGWPQFHDGSTLTYTRCVWSGRFDLIFLERESLAAAMPPWFIHDEPPPVSTTPSAVRSALPRYWSTRSSEPSEHWQSSIAVSPASGAMYVVAGREAMRIVEGKVHPIELTGPDPYVYYDSPLGFLTPRAFTSDGKGRIFFTTDSFIATLDDSADTFEPFAGDEFWYPAAIAANDNGSLIYAADPDSNVIYRMTKGKYPQPFVGRCLALSDGKPGYPSGRCRGGDADGMGDAARLNQPSALAYDMTDDILFVADTANNEIRGVRTDGTVYTLAGSCVKVIGNPNCIGMFADGKSSDARFFYPVGIAYDSKDHALYVVDKFNHAIRRVGLDGTVSTLAGGVVETISKSASEARQFCYPQSIAYDPVRDVLIVGDLRNLSILEVTTAGRVTTVFGDKLGDFDRCD